MVSVTPREVPTGASAASVAGAGAGAGGGADFISGAALFVATDGEAGRFGALTVWADDAPRRTRNDRTVNVAVFMGAPSFGVGVSARVPPRARGSPPGRPPLARLAPAPATRAPRPTHPHLHPP